MCFSGCKNENYHGECSKTIDEYDITLHCFSGFVCTICGDIFKDDIELNYYNDDGLNICKFCRE